jgi:pimeloyl-ACP methyl ester carboxylesterase
MLWSRQSSEDSRVNEPNMVNHLASGILIDTGRRRLYLNCTGQGNPTVILEAGPGSTSSDFASIQPALAKFTRTCSCDRSGLGKSDSAPTPCTCQDQWKTTLGSNSTTGCSLPWKVLLSEQTH